MSLIKLSQYLSSKGLLNSDLKPFISNPAANPSDSLEDRDKLSMSQVKDLGTSLFSGLNMGINAGSKFAGANPLLNGTGDFVNKTIGGLSPTAGLTNAASDLGLNLVGKAIGKDSNYTDSLSKGVDIASNTLSMFGPWGQGAALALKGINLIGSTKVGGTKIGENMSSTSGYSINNLKVDDANIGGIGNIFGLDNKYKKDVKAKQKQLDLGEKILGSNKELLESSGETAQRLSLKNQNKKLGTLNSIRFAKKGSIIPDDKKNNFKYKPYTAVQDNTYVTPKVVMPLKLKKKQQFDPKEQPVGSLPSYFKGSEKNPIELDEVTVTTKAPEWIKYREEFVKNNPFNIDEYVENRFNNPVGREAIEKIDQKGWRKKLKQEGLEKRYNSIMNYVGEQLVKNKPQGKLSRAEWLNQMTDKEEEIIKRNPKYQSSLWANTKRGLTSLVEHNPLQTFQNILNSSDYSNREKREMLKDYIDHPIMSKLGDITKILNPLMIPSKMVQSIPRDDYSFTDALKGKKNSARTVEDIVTDPLNLVGVGLLGKISKADKVIDGINTIKSGKNLIKPIGKVVNITPDLQINLDDIIKNLPKLEKSTLDFNIDGILKNNSDKIKNMEIIKKGNKYFKELSDPESLKRLKEFGEEYDIDLLDAYKKAKERWDYGTSIGKNDRFQVKKTDEEWFGLSTSKITDDEKLYGYFLENKFGKESKKAQDYYKKLHSDKSINYINENTPIELYDEVIWHELSHDINKTIINKSTKLQQEISNIFIKKEDLLDIEGVRKAREYTVSRYPSRKTQIIDDINNNSILDIGQNEINYITKPTETWAFLSTNLRQDLKNTGIIKNYNELLTPEKLEQAIKNGNTVFNRFEPYIKDKESFIKLFNKMTLTIAPAVLYLQSQNQNKNDIRFREVPTNKKLGTPNSIKSLKEGGKIFSDSQLEEARKVLKFKKGGNLIPEGALHARKHELEIEGITNKGIPIIAEEGGKIEQHMEIERNEIIFSLEVTKKLEELAKLGTDDAAIEAGKLLTYEIMENTEDRTNLIQTI